MEKQNFCEQFLHYRACLLNSEYVPSRCSCYEDKAGYRKASDVAREIFAEIEASAKVKYWRGGGLVVFEVNGEDFAELKKKYTETTEGEEWISVDERLTEKDGKYLVYDLGQHRGVSTEEVRITYFKKGDRYHDYMWKNHFSHWMTLPKPPKESEDTE